MLAPFDRRSFIRRTLAGALALVVPTARAGADRKRVVRTLREALDTNDPDAVAQFILDSPDQATAADLRERVLALRLMAHGTTSQEEMATRLGARRPGTPAAGKSEASCLACQGASHVLVRAASGNPQELRAYIDGVGGRGWLETSLATFQHRGLQAEVQRGLRTAGSRR